MFHVITARKFNGSVGPYDYSNFHGKGSKIKPASSGHVVQHSRYLSANYFAKCATNLFHDLNAIGITWLKLIFLN